MAVGAESQGIDGRPMGEERMQGSGLGDIPELKSGVGATEGESLAIGAEGQGGGDGTGIEGVEFAIVGQVPDLDAVVGAAGSDFLAIPAQSQTQHCPLMRVDGMQKPPRVRVPNFDGPVATGGDDLFTIGSQEGLGERPVVPGEVVENLPHETRA